MSQAPGPELRRRIGLGLLTLYGVGVMVGAGIYVLAGQVAGQAGLWAPLSFLLAGLVAAPTAVAYGELSARLPEAGGEVAYVREAFGTRLLPLLAAVMIVGGAVISAAAVLQGGVGYLLGLVDAPRGLTIVLVGAALIAAAAVGVLESLALAGLFTLVEVGGLLFVAWAGLAGEPSADWIASAAELPPLPVAGLAAGALLAFFAFIGFEDIVNMAEETRDPTRNVPRAIGLSLAISTLLYGLVAFAAVRAVPPEALAASDRPLALVVERGLGMGAGLFSVVAIFAALNGVLAQIVMASRMIYGAARGAPFLAPLAAVHPRFRTPARATFAVGAVVLAIALSVPLLSLAATSATILLMAFCAMNVALILLKRRGPPPPGAFAAPAWIPWTGLATALLALGGAVADLVSGLDGAALAARLPPARGRIEVMRPLAPISWLRVGGPAEALFHPADAEDLASFLAALPPDVPVTPLGLASNLIIRDGGLPGVAIRLGRAFAGAQAAPGARLRVGAAMPDARAAEAAAEAGIGGLEFLRTIPGAIGGAVRMNAGCYGTYAADVLEEATVVTRAGETRRLGPEDLGFAYRSTTLPDDWIVTSAVLRGRPAAPEAIRARMAGLVAMREASQPVTERSCGSTFRNPAGYSSTGAPDDPMDLKAWALIEAAGCRGLRRGGAMISEKHANFLLNAGGATADDLESLGEEVRKRVFAARGITLEWEIRRIGLPGA